VGEGQGEVVDGGRAAQVLGELLEPRDVVVGIAGDGAVAPREARAPPEIVVGDGGENPDAGRGAVLADRGDLAGDEMVVGDVEAVRPGQPGATAADIPLAGDGAERAGLV
jgi:hypothetical protein